MAGITERRSGRTRPDCLKSPVLSWTQEALDAIIEGAKAEAGFIENQLKLLLEGKEARHIDSETEFTAEVRDYDSVMQVAYGPSLLELNGATTTLYY